MKRLLIIVCTLLWIPYITMLPHELGHAVWVFITGGSITQVSLDFLSGEVWSLGGSALLIHAGAYSTCIALSVWLIISWRAWGLYFSAPLIWSLIYSLISYGREGFHSSDFKEGLLPVLFVVFIQLVAIGSIVILIVALKHRAANPNQKVR